MNARRRRILVYLLSFLGLLALGFTMGQWLSLPMVALGTIPMAIIADLHLDGGVDGIDAIILLRERLGRQVPGILVTADHSREVKERAKAKGIEYFSKPMKPAETAVALPAPQSRSTS